jgi:broad specificity phosphatase PhoE
MTVSAVSGVARVFLIRHADAAGYREDPIFGNHLTGIGVQQAQALARRASAWQVDAILSSDLHRAYETALALHRYHPSAPLLVDSDFRELYIRFDRIPRNMSEFFRACETSRRALERRLERAWGTILRIPYDATLVISHGRTIKYLIGRLIGHEEVSQSRLQIANTGITAIEISRAHGNGTLQFVNDTTHLTLDMIPQSFRASEFEGANGFVPAVGQWVKVRGAAADDGTFIALEVIVRAAKKRAGLEGIIQNVDYRQSTLHMVNKDIRVPEGVPIQNRLSDDMTLAQLHESDAVKVSGRWQDDEFVPEKIKVKNLGLNLEEIEGPISRINSDSRGFEALGLSVTMTERTSVEHLLHTHHGAHA